jgi:hypothetical protein
MFLSARATFLIEGTAATCAPSGASGVGQGKSIYDRVKAHVNTGNKFKWEDIEAIFAEEEHDAARRNTRELERLMEETGGLHPRDVPEVLNKNLPPRNFP